jgi:hypothetical protein
MLLSKTSWSPAPLLLQGRIKAQRQLAAAQAQAAQRALSVAREKAANEAKSEFMSLMCHEVRSDSPAVLPVFLLIHVIVTKSTALSYWDMASYC